MLKRKVKRVLEYFAAYSGKHCRALKAPELLVLGYHRILPNTHPEFEVMEPGMRVRPETLDMHIQVLKKYFEIVDLNDWVKRVKSNKTVPNKAVALTFDDGWVDNYEYAYPILKHHGVLATIFLVSSMVGTNKQFWSERVSNILSYIKNNDMKVCDGNQIKWFEQFQFDFRDEGSFGECGVSALISRLKQLPDHEIYESLAAFSGVENQFFSSICMLNKEQLLEMAASGLVSYGAHTRSHYRLNKITDAGLLEDEILGSKQDIESMLNIEVNGFCYPNGDFNNETLDVLSDEFQYACTTRKGWNSTKSDLLLLNRILLHDDVSHDPVSFKARISGLI